MSLSTLLSVACSAELTNALDLTTGRAPLQLRRAVNLTDGTGADQADLIFTDRRTLAASTDENLDLAGVLTDAFGASLTFARVKGLIVSAAAANTNNVVVGGVVSNGFITPFGDATDKVVVRPGGVFALFAPDATAYAVTAGTADLLQIANSGADTSVTYDVVIVGASA